MTFISIFCCFYDTNKSLQYLLKYIIIHSLGFVYYKAYKLKNSVIIVQAKPVKGYRDVYKEI